MKSEFEVRSGEWGVPAWWRHALIALATLILCSCQALLPPPETPTSDPFADDSAQPVEEPAMITDRPATPPRALTTSPVEARELTPTADLMPPTMGSPYMRTPSTPPPMCNGTNPAADSCICDRCDSPALVGPSDEYLCDGGDYGSPAAVRADWTVDGLEQEDAVAHYDTVDGRVLLTPSNRVCVYAPRFAAIRRVDGVQAHERRQLVDIAEKEDVLARANDLQPIATSTQRTAVAIDLGQNPANLFRGRQQAGEDVNRQAAMEAYNSLGAYANLEIIRTGTIEGSEKAKVEKAVQAAITWNGDQAVQVVFENKQAVAAVGIKQPGIVYGTEGPHSPWLRLLKMASTNNALPGEEVEFTLRFDNIGDQEIGNVTIVDNLATRLVYVPETAKSSVDASFSAVPNGSGSTVLRWEIKSPLKPGEGGILRFSTRVQ